MRSSRCATPSQKKRLSWVRAGFGRGREGAAAAARLARGRAELEQPEAHAGDQLAVLVAIVGALGDEVAGSERRLLLLGDVLDHRFGAQQVARTQVALILLGAVGGDHRGEARFVEELQSGERARGAPRFAHLLRHQPGHRPRLEHGGRRHDAAVQRARRELRVGIHGVAIVDRVAPVTDHRQVHRVARHDRIAEAHTQDRAQPLTAALPRSRARTCGR